MSDTEFLQLLTLATPILILLVVLAMIPLTRWQDEREDRRREAERKLKTQR